ncbi:MAG: MarR family transcriptional regulator [Marinilabiliales bacterium]|nr:MAG: MarR family transcriptional regulator [Marinilabiliales bacterium]
MYFCCSKHILFKTYFLAKKLAYTKHQRAAVEIIWIFNFLDEHISSILKGFGLTHVQFNILRLLQSEYPDVISVGEVKDRVLFKTSDVTRILDRLVKKELVERSLCEHNRRKMDLRISEKGLMLIDDVLPKLNKTLDELLTDKISEQEAALIVELLKKIRN